jgi:hypothetical protein
MPLGLDAAVLWTIVSVEATILSMGPPTNPSAPAAPVVPSSNYAAPPTENAEPTVATLLSRVEALEQRMTEPVGAAPQAQLAGIEVQVAQLATLMQRATSSSESVARAWMAVPGVIGVIVVSIGVAMLILAFAWAPREQFAATLWGAVVLIAVGASSATASALVARFKDSGSAAGGLPRMDRLA